jgi:hypothetical protein
LVVLAIFVHTAHAERFVIERGQTVQHAALAYGCSVEEVMRANGLRTTLVKPGTVLDIPHCSLRKRAQTRTRAQRGDAKASRARTDRAAQATPARSDDHIQATRERSDDEAKARAALAVIDGATWIEPPRSTATGETRSVSMPWDGELEGGEQLPGGEGYRVRRPELAYGAPHVVDHLRHSIAEVRALYPDVHTLAIGDLSAANGGKLAAHRSHQSGLDVDVGFYFKQQPDGYPEHFAPADDNLDHQATWALLTAFARTADLADGVSIMFLDYAVQRRLYQWAARRGTPEDDLAHLFQYPHGKDAQTGLIRHWPNHADHVHVRFKSR